MDIHYGSTILNIHHPELPYEYREMFRQSDKPNPVFIKKEQASRVGLDFVCLYNKQRKLSATS